MTVDEMRIEAMALYLFEKAPPKAATDPAARHRLRQSWGKNPNSTAAGLAFWTEG